MLTQLQNGLFDHVELTRKKSNITSLTVLFVEATKWASVYSSRQRTHIMSRDDDVFLDEFLMAYSKSCHLFLKGHLKHSGIPVTYLISVTGNTKLFQHKTLT